MTELLVEPTAVPDIAVKRCTCGHAEAEHDAVARRYCAATSSGCLSRGCICGMVSGGQHR